MVVEKETQKGVQRKEMEATKVIETEKGHRTHREKEGGNVQWECDSKGTKDRNGCQRKRMSLDGK